MRGVNINIYIRKQKQGNFSLIFAPKNVRLETGGIGMEREPEWIFLPGRVFSIQTLYEFSVRLFVFLFILQVYPERFLLPQTRSYNFNSCLQCFLFLHNNDDFDN